MDKTNDEILHILLSHVDIDIGLAIDTLKGVNWDLSKALSIFLPNTEPKKKVLPPQPKPQIIQEPPKEKLILFDKNIKFMNSRQEALHLQRKCLLVSIYPFNDKDIPPLPDFNKEDIFSTIRPRFHYLSLDFYEPDGKWFFKAYNIKKKISFAIIDPETSECNLIIDGPIVSKILNEKLRQFLIENSQKYGLPFDIDLDLSFINLTDSISSSSTSTDEEIIEKIDEGEIITFIIQFPNGKRIKIEIGENLNINSLYQKVSILAEMDKSLFNLEISFPKIELNDLNKKIKDYPLKKSLIHLNKK